jgi:alpha-tubulin suppressor-like RCC1 family protein
VPLNAIVVIVFSQPIDSATLTTSAVQLWQGAIPVAGTVRFSDATGIRGEFHPATLLAGLTDYRLVVTDAIRGVNGMPLAPPAEVGFTTGASAQAASRLGFLLDPGTISVGQPFTIQVAIEDSLGHPVSGASDSVTLTLGANPAGGTVSGTLMVAADNGIATFGSLSLDRAGEGYTLVATSASLPIATSATFSVVVLPASLVIASVTAGFYHTCALTAAGAAYCWGDNYEGQVGVGDTASQWIKPVLSVSGVSFAAVTAGDFHTCGLTPAGAAYCWGENLFGAIGDGSTTNRSSPVPVAGGLSFVALSAGDAQTCGVSATGAAYCWGYNGNGGLGDGTTTDRSTPALVAGGLGFAAVSAGLNHTCGVMTTGAAYCWGQNTYGQLGDGSATDRPSPVLVAGGLTFAAVAVGEHHSCGLTPAGTAYCWGWNSQGQLGDESTTDRLSPVAVAGGQTFAAIGANAYQTCATTVAGAAYCWGINGEGQLGDGTTDNRSAPGLVAGGISYARLTVGYHHTCGVTAAGVAYCWGANWNGSLGDGTFAPSLVPVKVAGQP